MHQNERRRLEEALHRVGKPTKVDEAKAEIDSISGKTITTTVLEALRSESFRRDIEKRLQRNDPGLKVLRLREAGRGAGGSLYIEIDCMSPLMGGDFRIDMSINARELR